MSNVFLYVAQNIVGIGCGICDGMGLGSNTKAAVLRLGLMEMVQFGVEYIPGCKVDTFFESCGIADLVATCHGGRNRMLGEAVIKQPEKVGMVMLHLSRYRRNLVFGVSDQV